jgi:hypothetical protein
MLTREVYGLAGKFLMTITTLTISPETLMRAPRLLEAFQLLARDGADAETLEKLALNIAAAGLDEARDLACVRALHEIYHACAVRFDSGRGGDWTEAKDLFLDLLLHAADWYMRSLVITAAAAEQEDQHG